jgi:hypothetical protein
MGPYASAAVAKQEAEALPRANPRGSTCVVVRANGMQDAIRAAVEAYKQSSTRLNPAPRANRGVEALPVRLPRSTQVQTLLFDSSLFNVGQAKSWAKRHGFRYGSVDTGGARASFIRLRQIDPAQITEGSFRTIRFTDGIEAVIGVPKRGAPRRKNGGPGAVRLNTSTQLAAAMLAPEVVAAHAAAGLAVRGVKAAGRGVGAVLSEAGSTFADIVGRPRKRTNTRAKDSVVLTFTLSEPENDLPDLTYHIRLYRVGPAGDPRTRTYVTITKQTEGRPAVEIYDGLVRSHGSLPGAEAVLNYETRLSGGIKRSRLRKRMQREIIAAWLKLSPGEA